MGKKVKRTAAKACVISSVILALGIAAVVSAVVLPALQTADNAVAMEICLLAGLALVLAGIIALCVSVAVHRARVRKSRKPQAERMQDAEAQLDGSATYNGKQVNYLPNMQAYERVNMGKFQSLDDKFDQIARMDRTQFVIYMTRLFSRNGYQVKLTPVTDNHSVDLIIERDGVSIAVGCILSDKILGQKDISPVTEGKIYYQVKNSMVVTNMYFDRTALDYAKAEHITLVDRNILAEDYM